MAGGRVLVVDDEPAMLENCRRLLDRAGYECATIEDPTDFRDVLREWQPDVLLLDVRMPRVDGNVLLTVALADERTLPVIMMTAFATVPAAVDALREGAFDYLAKPFTGDQLILAVDRAVRHRALLRENLELRERVGQRSGVPRMLGSSPAMEELRRDIEKAGGTDANVLITGESGTGKEVAARNIHAASARAKKDFVPVDCAALPAGLLESELFGHEKGAFTGATQRKVGLMERADGGTLFLDEITELTVALQAKLLRALEERQIRRLGGNQLIDVDIRVLAATNVDLEEAIATATFREDLYFRLQVIPINLPPLRDRGDDLFLLSRSFLAEVSRDLEKEPPKISPAAWEALEKHSWPGNIRELKNTMERLVILEEGGNVTVAGLPKPMRPLGAIATVPGVELPPYETARDAALRTFRAAYLEELLASTGGNITRAAGRAGVSRRTIHRWMSEGGQNGKAETS